MGKGTVTRRALRLSIERQRNCLLDLDLAVDARREGLDLAVVDLREAVRERDRAALHLERLVEWHDEIESIGATFGPEIAATFARQQLEARG